MTNHVTACPLDCPDSCSLEVQVSENGSLQEIRGTKKNPLTGGFICSKVRHFAKHVYCKERILHPAIRDGAKGEGRFRQVSWDEALQRICRQIGEQQRLLGPEAILPLSYGGSNGLLSQGTTDLRFFSRLGASQLARTVCAAPSTAAATGLYGKMPGVAFTDYPEASLIVAWGVNPSVSGIHLVPQIRKAQKRGARLVVIDPRRTNLAKQADLHLAPRPGTDLVIALSLIHYLFEKNLADREFLNQWALEVETLRQRAAAWDFSRAAAESDVPESELRRFADWYSSESPAVIRCGWGLERNRNGGSAVAAILALPAVAGKFGLRGGGYTMSNSGAWQMDSSQAAAAPPSRSRIINMNRLGEALAEAKPKIGVLFVYNCNPLVTLPHQQAVRRGLEREDLFSIVFDQVMTDTAAFADVLLPATSFLEHHDLARGYGAMLLHPVQPVLPAVGEARSNFQVFSELCRLLNLQQPGDIVDEVECRDAILDSRPDLRQSLRERGVAFPDTGFAPVQFREVFPLTPDRKIHLCPADLDQEAPLGLYGYQPDPASETYPLALVSPATGRTISSTLGQLHRKQVPLLIHPEDAAKRQITSGNRVEIFNALGRVECLAKLSQDVRPGTICLPKGLWSHNTLNGATANSLVPDSLTDLGGGACFNDARVEVGRMTP